MARRCGHAENAVERRADLVADRRKKARFGLARRLGPVARGGGRPQLPDFVAQPLQFGLRRRARLRACAGRKRSTPPAAAPPVARRSGSKFPRRSSIGAPLARRIMLRPIDKVFLPAHAAARPAAEARAVGERLGEMRTRHRFGAVEIGDGAGELQHAVEAARAEGEAVGRLANERRPRPVERRDALRSPPAGAAALAATPGSPSAS